MFSNCIGTSTDENIEGCTIKDDILTFVGSTSSSGFPITANAQQSSFGGNGDGISS